MERVPIDLRQPDIRRDYLEKHKQWFLQHHENALKKFEESVEVLYGSNSESSARQLRLLEEREEYEPNNRINSDALMNFDRKIG